MVCVSLMVSVINTIHGDNICSDIIVHLKLYKINDNKTFFMVTSAELVTGKTSKDVVVGSELFHLNPGVEKYKLTLTVITPSGTKGEDMGDHL